MRVRDTFGHSGYDLHLWTEVHQKLTYLVGKLSLTGIPASQGHQVDVLRFLATCSDAHFLDFIEAVFQTSAIDRITNTAQLALVRDINTFFSIDDLPYALTDFVWVTGTSVVHGSTHTVMTRTAIPQVLLKESGSIHETIVKPVLELIADPRFSVVNTEYREALQDYRKLDYGDCLTKCGSAFESTLKVICSANRWPFSPNDTAAPLLKTVVSRSSLDGYFEQPLMLIATVRNRLSKSHGGGTVPREAEKHVAEWAMNATGAAILLLVQECL